MTGRTVPQWSFAGAWVLVAMTAVGCGGGGGSRVPGVPSTSSLVNSLEAGDPQVAAATGYTGSAACITCHGDLYRTFEKTAHHRGLRTISRPGVDGVAVHANRDGQGRDDFRTGLNLGSLPAFAAFGVDAPLLLRVPRDDEPYKVSIAGVVYPVARVYGGQRREDYLVRVGDALYPAPFEWDERLGDYVPLETETWYDGTDARFRSEAAARGGIDREASFERRCAGCHHSGFEVSFEDGHWQTGYTELGVGCESCHGPGADHVLSDGDPARILNPRDLLDGTSDGRARADAVCGQCHTNGTGATLAGAGAPVEYPWKAGGGFRPGELLDDFVEPTADAGDYWALKDNATGPVPTPGDPSDDTWAAVRGGWMQAIDHGAGPHGAEGPFTPRCFDCHDPHGRAGTSSLREDSVRVEGLAVHDADGSLCLQCHAGQGPFAGIDTDDLVAAAGGNNAAVATVVTSHMADQGMAVEVSAYDPAGTAVGRCSSCHMVSTATHRRSGMDAAGFESGGVGGGGHGMRALWPALSENEGVTNSCNRCHPVDAGDDAAQAMEEWRRDSADDDGTFHASTPRWFQTGVLNEESGQGRACIACHTTEGFRRITVDGDPDAIAGQAGERSAVLSRAISADEGITCAACHGESVPTSSQPLRLAADALCASCHTDAGLDFDDYLTWGNGTHAPQQDMIAGTAGSEPPVAGSWEDSFHAGIQNACVTCHLDRDKKQLARHHFAPDPITCGQCHPAANKFDLIAFGDYDGDGSVEGLQTEITGLLEVLASAMTTADPLLALDGDRWERSGGAGTAGATTSLRRAAFNWETVVHDKSRGIHNPARTIRLLQRSYREITGMSVPGATIK